MLDRLISIVVAIFLALLVWLYARSRDQENLRTSPAQNDVGRVVRYEQASSEDTDDRIAYELADVPVNFLCPPSFPYRVRVAEEGGATVMLRITGPCQDDVPKVYAFVDLAGKSTKERTSTTDANVIRLEEPVQVHLPRRFRLDERDRKSIRFELIPATIPAAGNAGK